MPIYCFCCPQCGTLREVFRPMSQYDLPLSCECGISMNRYFTPPMIAGDTVAGGCDYNYYDVALGTQVHGKQHREQIMRERGLTEYVPDPTFAPERDEMHYIQKHMGDPKSDPDARRALDNVGRRMDKKRRKQAVSRNFDGLADGILKDLRPSVSVNTEVASGTRGIDG